IAGKEARDQCEPRLVLIAPVSVNALLVRPVGGKYPFRPEGVLEASAGVQRVWCFVVWIDDSARGAPRRAPGISWLEANAWRSIHGREGRHPTFLRQVIVKQAEAPAKHRCSAFAERVGHAEAGRDGPAIITRRAAGQRNPECPKRQQRGV